MSSSPSFKCLLSYLLSALSFPFHLLSSHSPVAPCLTVHTSPTWIARASVVPCCCLTFPGLCNTTEALFIHDIRLPLTAISPCSNPTCPMLSMYPPPGIHFRNPFVDNRTSQPFCHYNFDLDLQSPSGSAKVSCPAKKPITPPPDMNSVASHVQPPQYSFAPVKYEQRQYEQPSYSHAQASTQGQVHLPRPEVSTRPSSPVQQPHPVTFTNPHDQKRDSHMNAIAPSLQIPRSVNNSQGSIAELAAQVRETRLSPQTNFANHIQDHMLVLVRELFHPG